ncbi:hypothetical protein RJ641_009350 [Dillenia turbinata]|uniref:Uncharacterized protein n=1 Tax=Dillenia turbinata TaxID=194707 RepID=A0AAN8V547_9MAGN
MVRIHKNMGERENFSLVVIVTEQITGKRIVGSKASHLFNAVCWRNVHPIYRAKGQQSLRIALSIQLSILGLSDDEIKDVEFVQLLASVEKVSEQRFEAALKLLDKYGVQWIVLMEALAAQCDDMPELLKISAITKSSGNTIKYIGEAVKLCRILELNLLI